VTFAFSAPPDTTYTSAAVFYNFQKMPTRQPDMPHWGTSSKWSEVVRDFIDRESTIFQYSSSRKAVAPNLGCISHSNFMVKQNFLNTAILGEECHFMEKSRIKSPFMDRLRKRTGKPITQISAQAMERFMEYGRPGNVRELKSDLEDAFVIAEKEAVSEEHLPHNIPAAQRQIEILSYYLNPSDELKKTVWINALIET
jgi:hypothetical protein